MMDFHDPRETTRRKRAGLSAMLIFAIWGLGTSLWRGHLHGLQPLWFGLSWVAIIGLVVFAWPRDEFRTASRRDASRSDAIGLAHGDGVPLRHWRRLSLVSRLMPPAAGRRWLAEAESVLSELPADRRSAAARSYLRSAPRLTATLWIREMTRLGARRPG